MLQFWTQQGALLPEAEVQPEQQTEQRRRRTTILRWAADHPHHRDLQFLADYMARMRDAAAAGDWANDPWRIALRESRVIVDNISPANLLSNLQAGPQALAEHGIYISRSLSLMLANLGSEAVATRAVPLLLALDALPISLDYTEVVSKAPTLLNLHDVGAVLQRRVAAMQQLHPQLDVAQVLRKQPSLLTRAEQTVASQWASLRTASGLSNDDTRALVQLHPAMLTYCSGVVGWKLQQLHAYQSAKAGSAGSAPLSSMSRVLAAAPHRVWRLCYLAAAGNFKYVALIWVRMEEDRFASLNRGTACGLPRTLSLLRHTGTGMIDRMVAVCVARSAC